MRDEDIVMKKEDIIFPSIRNRQRSFLFFSFFVWKKWLQNLSFPKLLVDVTPCVCVCWCVWHFNLYIPLDEIVKIDEKN